jgi:NAD(P)-dependent dehydrogenase (short-subunit alcohol dehydrogenase family)
MSTIFITGANKGIGLELCRRYAGEGHVVLASCRDLTKSAQLKAIKGHVEILELDVGVSASVAGVTRILGARPIDLLINNAGIMGPDSSAQTALNMDFDGWAETFAVNTMGPVRVLQALLPNLKKSSSARVVNITSQMGAISLDMPLAFAYCSSKAALNKFTKLAAGSLAEEGIHVCLIHPGWVKTDMGGKGAEITPAQSAAGIAETIENLNQKTTGSFWKWDGQPHEW